MNGPPALVLLYDDAGFFNIRFVHGDDAEHLVGGKAARSQLLKPAPGEYVSSTVRPDIVEFLGRAPCSVAIGRFPSHEGQFSKIGSIQEVVPSVGVFDIVDFQSIVAVAGTEPSLEVDGEQTGCAETSNLLMGYVGWQIA
jgi:hypothetical protein